MTAAANPTSTSTTRTADGDPANPNRTTPMNITSKIATAIAATLLVGGLAACSSSPTRHDPAPSPSPKPSPSWTPPLREDQGGPKPKTFSFSGDVEVSDYLVAIKDKDGMPCVSDSGYNDVNSGSQVKITNESGKLLAVATLDSGTIDRSAGACDYSFDFVNVPGGSKFYSIHVGNPNRGDVTYTRSQLESGVSLTLGS